MNVVISKWGNSLGVRIPAGMAKSLNLKNGDHVTCELKDNGLFMQKKQSTKEMFEEFYGKPFDEITQEDIGPGEEIDWGEDVGEEIIK
ncbi:MAG: AbrB/MazE/SpoVT family DNA-binding domain-containing protein [Clostridiales bacterium]|jgi:antitoxin MazE|nr:AbrB/MazE/SpoVT family DNA-binding domain-containing protein [Clostridiales bacterium]